jgi:hypothetical protein
MTERKKEKEKTLESKVFFLANDELLKRHNLVNASPLVASML